MVWLGSSRAYTSGAPPIDIPVWSALPSLQFALGTASSINLAGYCTDPQGETLTFTLATGTLPAGITLASTGVLSYSGAGAVASASGVSFTATNTTAHSATSSSTTVSIAQAQQGSLSTAVTLTSGVTASFAPWTVGLPIKQGDVPVGNYVTATSGTSQFQADARNFWPDGSVKYAVLSGVSSFTAGTPLTIALAATTTAPTGSVVPAPTALNSTSVQISAPTTGSFPLTAGTYAINSVLGNSLATWAYPNSGGLVRSVPGVVMSEYHYYQPTSSPYLNIWWYVRAYATGAVEVEVVLENGWWMTGSNPTAPTEVDYSVAVVVNGLTTFSQTNIQHFNYTRWGRVDWYAGGSPITPAHNVPYLLSTKLVPNYGWTSPSTAALTQWAQTTTNLASVFTEASGKFGDIVSGATLDSTGQDPHIGVLPRWEALYCTSADPHVYTATIGNTRQWGAYGYHFRDANTGRLVNWTSYPNNNCYGSNSPSVGGTNGGHLPGPPTWAGGLGQIEGPTGPPSHTPAVGYLAYLIEGRWSQMEEVSMTAHTCSITLYHAPIGTISASDVSSTRGFGWAFNILGKAATINPTKLGGATPAAADVAFRNSLVTALNNTVANLKAIYVDGSALSGAGVNVMNAIGFMDQYDRYSNWFNGTLTASQNTITAVAGISSITVGTPVSDWNGLLPAGTHVSVAYTGGGTVTLNNASTGSGVETGLLSATYPATELWGGAWMVAIQGQAVGHVAEISPEGANMGALVTLRNFVWQDNLLTMQIDNVTWNFRRACTYERPYGKNAPNPNTSNPTYGAITFLARNQGQLSAAFADYQASFQLSTTLTANYGDTLKDHGSDTDTAAGSSSSMGDQGFWAWHSSVVAMATEANAPGIHSGNPAHPLKYSYLTGASNWDPTQTGGTGANDAPEAMFAPRAGTVPAALPASGSFPGGWYWQLQQSFPTGGCYQFPNSTLAASAAYTYAKSASGSTGAPGVMAAWSGGCLNTVGIYASSPGANSSVFMPGTFQMIFGGGHVDYGGNEVYAYGPLESNPSSIGPPYYYGNPLQWWACRAATNPPPQAPGFSFTASCTNGVMTVSALGPYAEGGMTGLAAGQAIRQGAAEGTTITAQTGGTTGGIGTYTISPSQTFGSTPNMYSAVPFPGYDASGNPVSSHTQDTIVYRPLSNWLMRVGYFAVYEHFDSGGPTTQMAVFQHNVPEPDVNQPWNGGPTTTPLIPLMPLGVAGGTGGATAYDEVNDRIWYWDNTNYQLQTYDFCSQTWNNGGSPSSAFGAFNAFYIAGCHDPKRQLFAIYSGATNSAPTFQIRAYPTNGGLLTNTAFNITTTGTGPTWPSAFYGTLVYDKVLDCFVLWTGNGAAPFYTLTAPASGSFVTGAWVWAQLPVAGAVPDNESMNNTGGTNGTYKRFNYVPNPAISGYVLVNRVNPTGGTGGGYTGTGSVYFYAAPHN